MRRPYSSGFISPLYYLAVLYFFKEFCESNSGSAQGEYRSSEPTGKYWTGSPFILEHRSAQVSSKLTKATPVATLSELLDHCRFSQIVSQARFRMSLELDQHSFNSSDQVFPRERHRLTIHLTSDHH